MQVQRIFFTTSFVSAIFVVASCSLLVDLNTGQCESNVDCETLSGGNLNVCQDSVCIPDPVFACGEWPEDIPTEPLTFDWKALSLVNQKPIAGLKLSVCNPNASEEDCIAAGTTNAAGELAVPLYEGFNGTLRVAGVQEGTAPYILYKFPPPSNKETSRPPLVSEMLSIGNLIKLGDDIGRPPVPGTGHIIFTINDCTGKRLPDVFVYINGAEEGNGTFDAYLDDNKQVNSTLRTTSSQGSGGVINIPAGRLVNFTVESQSRGVIFTSGGIKIEPDTVTHIDLQPLPPAEDLDN